jgi:polysaccharide deacetylase 2 family uncharacterized protein YibQ
MTRAWSFRPLILFWSVVMGMSAGTALALQLMGPPPASVPTAATAAAVAGSVPASAPAGSANPAPPLKLTGREIPEPDPGLQEPSIDFPDRMLPRIGNDGRMPAQLYASPFDPSERHPKVALVLDGAGLDRALTEQAMRALPAAIDFAFSAYAPPAPAAKLASFGRGQGRECLVSIPMEPSGFPMMEEGDKSLLTGADPAKNRENLEWALSSVQGCVGATGGSDGLNGERFAESRQSFGDVLAAVDRRGLLYLDARPGAEIPADAGAGRLAPRRVDVVVNASNALDEPSSAQDIDQNLAKLEQIAARTGAAIGLAGPPTPVLIDRIEVWAQGLAAKGLVLAPLSAMPPPPRPPASPPL